jgi:cobalt-zinc-cadmium efflux system outer membrane protein
MHRLFAAAFAAAAICLWPNPAHAENFEIDLERALSLARERAPALAAARARIAEAQGRLAGASIAMRENPALEALVGKDLASGGRPVVEATLWQPIELGGGRSARISAARAAIDRERAGVEISRRALLREVAIAYFRALHARERVRIAEGVQVLARAALEVADRRQKAGEAGTLDGVVARAALGRARAESRAAAADLARATGELEMLLGLRAADRVVLKGSLAADRPRPALPAAAPKRPELRLLAAERAEADAEAEAGRARRWPDFALGVRYAQEEEQRALLGGVSFSLPFFERGQATTQSALARRTRAALELSAGQRSADVELRTARDTYRRRLEVLAEIERGVLPNLDQGERIARRSYEVGETALVDLIAVRREFVEARRAHLDALLTAAVAAVELQAITGELR